MVNYKFAGLDTVSLAEKYGTPLYLMWEDFIRERLNEIKLDFLSKYENTDAVYASKAFLTREMARIVMDEGIGIDVVSGGELYTINSVGFPMEKVIFHGNNKSIEELDMAIDLSVGTIVVDNFQELELIDSLARKNDKLVNIMFRISPGVESNTHSYIQTSQLDSKFGIVLDEENISRLFNILQKSKNLNYLGLHFHVGSQLHDYDSHLTSIKKMMKLISFIEDKFKIKTRELNTGGGYGIKYTDEESKPLSFFTDKIMETVEKSSKELKIDRPKIIIEPGRWVVGEAGMTVYKIGSIKEIPGLRTYVSVDGGMTDNIRPSLYNAKYDAIVLNKPKEERTEEVTIAGKCCESGDILIKDILLPKLESGDYLGVFSTGAYNYSMASNYNKIPRPAVVMIKDGKDRLIVRRESYRDLIEREI